MLGSFSCIVRTVKQFLEAGPTDKEASIVYEIYTEKVRTGSKEGIP